MLPVLDITRQVVRWDKTTPPNQRIYRVPWRRTLYITRTHKIFSTGLAGSVVIREARLGHLLSKKQDVCQDSDYYEIYNIHIKNHEKNHLVVNYGKIVGAGDAKN